MLHRLTEPITAAVREGLLDNPLDDLVVLVTSEDDVDLSIMCMTKAQVRAAMGPPHGSFRPLFEQVLKPTREPERLVWILILTPTIHSTAAAQVFLNAVEGGDA